MSARVIDQQKSLIVFSNGSSNEPPSSLYEDAVTLGRLRGRLHDLGTLSDSVAERATVQNRRAFLRLDSSISAAAAASAIETALSTRGVTSVQVAL